MHVRRSTSTPDPSCHQPRSKDLDFPKETIADEPVKCQEWTKGQVLVLPAASEHPA
jgi:hypothetical protein